MTSEFSLSRRQVLLTGTTISLALAIPAFASEKKISPHQRGIEPMTHSYVTTKDGVEIFYKDWGPKDAQPIVFHHGWPLSSDDWDAQMLFFVSKGYRVVAHDRRGHGRSSQVSDGHDMDHYAACATPSISAIRQAAAKSLVTSPNMGSRRAVSPRLFLSAPFRR